MNSQQEPCPWKLEWGRRKKMIAVRFFHLKKKTKQNKTGKRLRLQVRVSMDWRKNQMWSLFLGLDLSFQLDVQNSVSNEPANIFTYDHQQYGNSFLIFLFLFVSEYPIIKTRFYTGTTALNEQAFLFKTLITDQKK